MIVVEKADACDYCKRNRATLYCGNCHRCLCPDCNTGLQCKQRKCSARPDGTGVR